MNKNDLIKQPINIEHPDFLSVGVTWVDGRIFIKENKPQAHLFYAICHYSNAIFAITPDDYPNPLMITSIIVTPPNVQYSRPFCEKGHCCIHFDCELNRFDKDLFANEFKTCSILSDLANSFLSKKTLWFNEREKIEKFWKGLALKPEGDILRFSKEKFGEVQK